jgi:hypothetical protein
MDIVNTGSSSGIASGSGYCLVSPAKTWPSGFMKEGFTESVPQGKLLASSNLRGQVIYAAKVLYVPRHPDTITNIEISGNI